LKHMGLLEQAGIQVGGRSFHLARRILFGPDSHR
jgi:hypothetical protein